MFLLHLLLQQSCLLQGLWLGETAAAGLCASLQLHFANAPAACSSSPLTHSTPPSNPMHCFTADISLIAGRLLLLHLAAKPLSSVCHMTAVFTAAEGDATASASLAVGGGAQTPGFCCVTAIVCTTARATRNICGLVTVCTNRLV